jgi:ubiquinone biosynthesis protein COQ9
MPTPSIAPSAALIEKILPEMLKQAGEEGWNAESYAGVLKKKRVSHEKAAIAFPDGVSSLIGVYFARANEHVSDELTQMDQSEMRIRDKVTSGVRIWFEYLSQNHQASVRALDWCAVHPAEPVPIAEMIWQVADAVWTGTGDTSTGFTYMSKRTILTGVIASTLAVWRRARNDDAEWSAFLDRRIADVMAFEKFKAGIRLPFVA